MLLWILVSVIALIVIVGLVTAISVAPVFTFAIAAIAGTFFYIRNYHR